MNGGSTVFKGVAAALVLIAGGFGCSHSNGDQHISKSERREQAKSERLASQQNKTNTTNSHSGASVAEAPPLTYANQPTAGQPTPYSTNVPVGMAPHQDAVVTVTATDSSKATYSAPVVAVQNNSSPTNGSIAAAQRQSAAVTVTAPEAPPATKSETPTHTPSNDEFWVNGNWRWDSKSFTWQPGRMERLRQDKLYHPATWMQSAQGWDFTPEYWQ